MKESKKTYWFEKYQTKHYRGVEYIMFDVTPQEAEDKIQLFLDKLSRLFSGTLPKVEVRTEGSNAILIDTFHKHLITERDLIMDAKGFIISKKGKEYRIRYVL